MKKLPYLISILLLTSIFFYACSSSKQVATTNQMESNMNYHPKKEVVVGTKDPKEPTPEEILETLIKNKYAKYLQTSQDNIHNIKLYVFIDEWLNTPYLWGGNSKKGIDCSAFVQRLYAAVYRINVPRTSIEQFFTQRVEPFKNKDYLQEGDLVFFKTIKGTTVSHVGFYLSNHRFVNASSSKGVSIGNLEDHYWKEKFVAAGRIRGQAQ